MVTKKIRNVDIQSTAVPEDINIERARSGSLPNFKIQFSKNEI